MTPIARDRSATLRIVLLCGLAFGLNVSYGLARPTTEGLFLDQHGHTALPLVWLLETIVSVLLAALYGRLMGRCGILRLLGATALWSGVTLTLALLLHRAGTPGALHALYLWKDLYVVLLVELFYCYANSVFPLQLARWLYGLFGALGAAGGITGSLLVRGLAPRLGAQTLLWATVPVLLGLWLVVRPLARLDSAEIRAPQDQPSHLGASLAVVRRSRYLLQMLLLVATVQVVITLVDFDFNALAERTYRGSDQLTAGIATVYGAISVLTFCLHLLTGPLLRLLGVPLTLVSIPLLLLAGQSVHVALSLFVTVAAVKVASKCFDYSILRAAKELLYIPLGPAERTLGKTVVDIATYRVAKGGAALLLQVIQVSAVASRTLTLALMGLWAALAAVIARRFRAQIGRDVELHAARR